MMSRACTASPYPPQVGGRLVVALAQALQGRQERELIEGIRRPETEAEAADTARQVALALRATCRVVAADLARGTGAAGQPPSAAPAKSATLAERLTATATQIGDVLDLVDRTTEQMSLLARDAMTVAPGSGAIEEGLSVVASEVSSLSLYTQRANLRVARQIAAMRGGRQPEPDRRTVPARLNEVNWMDAPTGERPRPAPPTSTSAAPPAADFCLTRWLERAEPS